MTAARIHVGWAIDDEAALRARYGEPHPAVVAKSQPRIDATAEAFLALSPLFVLATTSDRGTDASPRGGPPGFVTVLDEGRLAFGDLSGNNRLDSYANIVRNPEVGMLFLVPGVIETVRVAGRARLVTDPDVLDRTTVGDVRPGVAVVVDVAECFVHCGKALRRAAVWDPDTQLTTAERTAIFRQHVEPGFDPIQAAAEIDASYDETLWLKGGE